MIRIQPIILYISQIWSHVYTLHLLNEFEMIRIGFDNFNQYLYCLFELGLPSIFEVKIDQTILQFND